MAITADGRSGSSVTLQDGVVVKRAPPGQRAERLAAQYAKQLRWGDVGPFKTVPLLGAQMKTTGFNVHMRYCGGVGAPQWIGSATPAQLRQFAEDLVQLIASMVARSPTEEVPESLLADKVHGVVANAAERGWRKERLQRAADSILGRVALKTTRCGVPVGLCHGDLTLANVLFTQAGHGQQRYWLLDHLNVFLESPLLDMAKLRQETRLQWASRTSIMPHDRIRYASAMRWLDAWLVRHWRAAFIWWRVWAPVYEAINLLRILPYLEPGSRLGGAVLTELEEYTHE